MSTMDEIRTTLGRLKSDSTVFMLCDFQEKFRLNVDHFNEIAEVAKRLIRVGKILKIPLLMSEQYPQGLGNTIRELGQELDCYASLCIPKTQFSMIHNDVDLFLAKAESVVLFGVEAHVSVQQTALELVSRRMRTHVVADATSSRRPYDRKFAFERMRQSGVFITTAESIIFELLGDKNHESFKEIQAIIKTPFPNTGL